ncbi:MAG: DUF4055 domain-containing protein, partial [Moraxellaceae bacterium]
NYVGRAFADDPMFDHDGNEYLESDANGAGMSIYQLAQAGLKEQLEQGGFGLLVDYPKQATGTSKLDREVNGVRATINLYHLDNIINWRVSKRGNAYLTSLVVLAETITETTDDFFVERELEQWRVLMLDADGYYLQQVWRKNEAGTLTIVDQYYPLNASGQQWTEILFQICGSLSNRWKFGDIPLQPLAMVNIAHYHNSADYEDSLYICGQVQPVINGLTETWAEQLKKDGVFIGSRTPIMLPVGGSFDFAQAKPNMLAKEGMDDKLAMMLKLGARLVEQGSAVKTATQSNQDAATQHSILSLCAANLNEALNNCLKWVAAFNGSGDKAVFEINQDFTESTIDVQLATLLQNAAASNKISWATFWDYLKTGKVPEHGYGRELALIENPNPDDVPE